LPTIIALYEEDAYDALEYLGITNLIGAHLALCRPREINYAYVGYGYGICTHWLDRDTCLNETLGGPTYDVLLVDYSRNCLSVDWSRLRSPGRLPTYQPLKAVIDFDAGSEPLDPNWSTYWQHVRAIVGSVVEANISKTLSVVMLVGESAEDATLRENIERAVADFGSPTILVDDPIYVTAKGAADIGWRSLEIERHEQQWHVQALGEGLLRR